MLTLSVSSASSGPAESSTDSSPGLSTPLRTRGSASSARRGSISAIKRRAEYQKAQTPQSNRLGPKFRKICRIVSAPSGLILEILNLEKMQHVMQKKWILKMQTKATAERKCKKKEIINAQKMQMQKRNAKQI